MCDGTGAATGENNLQPRVHSVVYDTRGYIKRSALSSDSVFRQFIERTWLPRKPSSSPERGTGDPESLAMATLHSRTI